MIDIKLIRDNPEMIKANCCRRGCDVDIDAIVSEDQKYRELVQETETLRADRNRLSKECRDNPAAREQVKEIKEKLSVIETEQAELKKSIDEKLTWLPNLLADDVPDGDDDEANLELRKEGVLPEFDFKVKERASARIIQGKS